MIRLIKVDQNDLRGAGNDTRFHVRSSGVDDDLAVGLDCGLYSVKYH